MVPEAFESTFAPPRATASHSSGRSRAQFVNLVNIAVYVVARIVLVPVSEQASGEFQRVLRGRAVTLDVNQFLWG
jgi:hypothetical protein